MYSIVCVLIALGIAVFCGFLLFKIKEANKKAVLLKKLLDENENLHATIQNQSNTIVDLKKKNYELKGLAIVAEQMDNAIMLMNEKGDIVYVNEGFERLYEYTYDEFTTKLGNNIRKTSFNPAIMERLKRCHTEKKPVTYEALNTTKSGKEVWTHTSLNPLLNDKKEVIGLVTIDSDIHKRVVASDTLISKMEDMNVKVDSLAKQFCILESETLELFETISKSKKVINETDQIIKFIKEISDKTKILGINASIEANIAGNYGRGFRVIANEIVQISNKTIDSVTQITAMISSVKDSYSQIRKEKKESQSALQDHLHIMNDLKAEIAEIESTIAELK